MSQRERAMPLGEFDEAHRTNIERLVAQDKPPPRWLKLGDPERGVVWAEIPSRAWYEWYWQRGLPPGGKKHKLDPFTREYVIARDGLVCGLCGEAVEIDDVHIDHIEPRSLGGSDHPENLQVAHSLCNMRKGNRV